MWLSKYFRILVCYVNWGHVIVAAPITVIDDDIAKVYLRMFNYIHDFHNGIVVEYVEDHIYSGALSLFQEMANIPMTGKLDDATKKMMKQPRCPLADIAPDEGFLARKERYSIHYGIIWQKANLTYKITGLHPNVSDKANGEIRRAFDAWQAVIPLTITRKEAGSSDMTFYFFSSHDGPLFLHFHDSIYWTMNLQCESRTIWSVAAHVIGHALGLAHSWTPGAIMWPFFQLDSPTSELHVDDIVGIQTLYGKRSGGPTPQPFLPFQVADFCILGHIDAISRSDDDKHYVFSGKYFAELVPEGIAFGYPHRIEKRWPGIEGPVDAVLWAPQRNEYVNKRTGYTTKPAHTIFFKGNLIWRYVDRMLQTNYPRNITDEFIGLPSNIDSAFTLKGYNKFFFTKGSSFYRYSENCTLDEGFPQPIHNWQGMPDSFHAAFQYYHAELTFIFHGVYYYLIDHENFQLVRGYPRLIDVNWLGCLSGANMAHSHDTEIGRIQLKQLSRTFSGANVTRMTFTTEEPHYHYEQPGELTSGYAIIRTSYIIWSSTVTFILAQIARSFYSQ